MYSGFDANGEWYQLFQIGFGGVPGRPAGDGPDGHSMWPGFTNVPNEFLEAYFPLRIVDYAAIPDSGGPGEHRGGDGIRVAYEFLEPGQISIHDDRWLTYPWGVNGGHPGARSKKLLVRADGSEEALPSKCDNIMVAAGDRLLFDTWGGGGWGDPLKRVPERCAEDVRRGLASIDGVRRYGVVLTPALEVDELETTSLRSEIAASRPALQMFERGGTMEEIKARAKLETGFEAPTTPRWPRWATRSALVPPLASPAAQDAA